MIVTLMNTLVVFLCRLACAYPYPQRISIPLVHCARVWECYHCRVSQSSNLHPPPTHRYKTYRVHQEQRFY